MASTKIVASMTIREGGRLTKIVEVKADASHFNFYHWRKYAGRGKKRSEGKFSHRGDGTHPYKGERVGLEALAARYFTNGEAVKITIKNKKLYKHLTTCAVHLLPGYRPSSVGRHFVSKNPPQVWLIIGFPSAESVMAKINQPIPVTLPRVKRKAGALS